MGNISIERYTELIRKEEQLTIIARMLTSGKCIFAEDIKLILGIEDNATQGKE